MSAAKYEALRLLTLDMRCPAGKLYKETGITETELLELVAETNAKHYRVLGYLPPSEFEVFDNVSEFYDALEEAGLVQVKQDSTGRAVGCVPQTPAAQQFALNVPAYGKYWHAWNPEILDLLA